MPIVIDHMALTDILGPPLFDMEVSTSQPLALPSGSDPALWPHPLALVACSGPTPCTHPLAPPSGSCNALWPHPLYPSYGPTLWL